jgi:hypothetical protein
MPANVTPQYRAAEKAFREAHTVPEKIAALEEMYATIPKHKGTEKMQADIKRRLAKLRTAAKQAKGKAGVDPFHVERHGAGQLVMVGMPNAGKSALVKAVSGAPVKVAPYPFATHGPVPGMMPFEDVQIQLVDMPPLSREYSEAALFNTYRVGDIILLVVSLAEPDPAAVLRECIALFEERLIRLVPHRVDPAGNASNVDKHGLVLANQADLAEASAIEKLAPAAGDLPVIACSAETGAGLEELPGRLFRELGLVRIYTKKPGKKFVRDAPFVLPEGSTVLDVARAIHKDFAEGLRSVRLWGSGKHDGLTAPRDHVVADGDILEIHTR